VYSPSYKYNSGYKNSPHLWSLSVILYHTIYHHWCTCPIITLQYLKVLFPCCLKTDSHPNKTLDIFFSTWLGTKFSWFIVEKNVSQIQRSAHTALITPVWDSGFFHMFFVWYGKYVVRGRGWWIAEFTDTYNKIQLLTTAQVAISWQRGCTNAKTSQTFGVSWVSQMLMHFVSPHTQVKCY